MLGLRIAVLRRSFGWSQKELARRLGISSSAVGMYEQGRREPAVDVLVKLAAAFGVTTDYLLTGITQNQTEAKTVNEAVAKTIGEVDKRLLKRDKRPFTRDELTVIYAAMMLDT